ncbi:hypothetical protein RHGRI_027683 [Rhododendron griersonianum]|uniref:Wound-induced protein 1 n=1 Tax=Rhododendron griersonianum TaxID=479676 RepID=A0AAV6J042_9ERIC|nr:hypothetical protein RHGRI_027683 [Rhododendron griersonianum]
MLMEGLANSHDMLEESSRLNERVVLTLYEALSSRDVDTVHKLLAPDLEWWFHGPPSHQFMMRLLTGSSASSTSFEFVAQSIAAFGSAVFVEGCDPTRSISWVHVWTVKDGIITQVREYFNTSLTVTCLGNTAQSLTPYKFFEFYADIPEEKEVKYAAHKLYGYVSTWWERLQSNRLRQYKQPIRTWPRMRRLISDRFLQSNRGQELYQEYRRKLKSKQMFRDNFDVQYSHVTADTNYSRNMPMSLTQLSFGSQKKNQVPSSSSQSFHNYYDGYEVAEEEGDRVEFSDKDEVGDEEEIGSAEDCLSVPTVEQQFDLDRGATNESFVPQELANSQEILEESKIQRVVLALYEALSARDVDTVHKLLAPDLEWWFHGPPSHQFMMRLLTGSSTSSFKFVPQSVAAFGSTVLVEGCDHRRSISWIHAWTVTADGIITQVREYFNTSLTVTRFGNADRSSPVDFSSASSSSINALHCPSVWESSVSDRVGISVPGLVLAL